MNPGLPGFFMRIEYIEIAIYQLPESHFALE